MYVCIYIYIYTYICIHIYIHTSIPIYIYIEREREIGALVQGDLEGLELHLGTTIIIYHY